MNILEIKNITKRFDDKLILDNISFKVKEGEIYGLLGPNGAGKSTLINIITGILKSDSGSIEIGGYDIKKQPNKAKQLIGIVPQDIALYNGLNAKDNLEFWGSLYGLKGNLLKERIQEAIKIAGLEEHQKKVVKKYSGGMKRRLNIAAAMMHRPKILIMDEPTVGVDPQSRNHIFNIIKEMNEKYNTTVIYTSHYMEEIELLCRNIIIIDLGKELIKGDKEEVKKAISDEEIINITIDRNATDSLLRLKEKKYVRKIEIDNNKLKIITNTSVSIGEILKEVEKNNTKILNIGIQEATLEEVFLSLTGKKLRDKEE